MTVKFFARQQSRSDQGTLWMRVSHGSGKTKTRSLGIEVPPNLFTKKGNVKSTVPGAAVIQKIISQHRDRVYEAYYTLVAEGFTPELDHILAVYERGDNAVKKTGSVTDVYDIWADRKESKVSKGTMGNVQAVGNELFHYEQQRKKPLLFGEIGLDFVNEISERLASGQGYSGRRNQNSTIRVKMSMLIEFLKWCHKEGYISDTSWEAYAPPKMKDENRINLTEEEVDMLYKFDVRACAPAGWEDRYECIFYSFLFSCDVGGLRYNSWDQIRESNMEKVDGILVMYVSRKKNSTHSVVPVTQRAYNLVEKIQEVAWHPDNREANIIIKNVCKAAGIAGEYKKIVHYGKEKEVDVEPRWNLVSTHTARSVFVTKCKSLGMASDDVGKLAGFTPGMADTYYRPGREAFARALVKANPSAY
jgi:site-specific recombinase XerD